MESTIPSITVEVSNYFSQKAQTRINEELQNGLRILEKEKKRINGLADSAEAFQILEQSYRADLEQLEQQPVTDKSSATSLWNQSISRTNTLERETISWMNRIEREWTSAIGENRAPRDWIGPRGPKSPCDL